MQRLAEIVLEKSVTGAFSLLELSRWVGGTSDRRFGLLKRALKSGEVIRIHQGLCSLAPRYLRRKSDPLVFAQWIHGPSYISLETALAYHGWIPEAVYSATRACMDRAREFETPFGHFSFTRIPQKVFYTEVTRMENRGGQGMLSRATAGPDRGHRLEAGARGCPQVRQIKRMAVAGAMERGIFLRLGHQAFLKGLSILEISESRSDMSSQAANCLRHRLRHIGMGFPEGREA